MNHPSPFADWLRQRRRALDMTRAALADAVGCSAALIAKIEAGQRRPSAQVAGLLARALHVPDNERDTFMRLARNSDATPPPLPARAMAAGPPDFVSLPQPLSALHGRDALLAQLTEQLTGQSTRLLTLSGPPGVGKTRLAIALARRAAFAFPNGVLFVPLATAREPAQALDTIAQALDLQGHSDTALGRLVAALATRRMLLVLDNTEQVSAVAPQLVELLLACPDLTLLVTSRERLRVRGEHVVALMPLPLPRRDAVGAAAVGQSPAVALFVEAAQASYAPFALTNDNAAVVAAICRKLDGLPLALELVAAASPTLTPSALLYRLEESLGAADAALRDLPARQRSLRAALDWSHDLLDDHERRLLARLGVFAGRWELGAAEAICGDIAGVQPTIQLPPSSIATTLGALVDKSMVQRHDANRATQFTMLEVVREYARARLYALGEADALRERHTAYYIALAKESAEHIRGPAQQQVIARLREAHPEFDAVIGYLLETGRYEQAAQLTTALRRFWWMTAFLPQGRRWLDTVVQHLDALAIPTRADVFNSIGMLTSGVGEIGVARAALEQSLLYARRSEDEQRIGIALHNLGVVLATLGEYDAATALLQEALALDRAAGDQWGISLSLGALASLHNLNGAWDAARATFEASLALAYALDDKHSIALTLHNLGEAARHQGDFVAAERYLAEALSLALAQESRLIPPYVLNNQALVALHQTDLPRARALLLEALALVREIHDMHELAANLRGCAHYAALVGSPPMAARLLGAAAGIAARHGISDSAGFRADIAAIESIVRHTISEGQWAEHWQAGRTLTDEAALVAASDALRLEQADG